MLVIRMMMTLVVILISLMAGQSFAKGSCTDLMNGIESSSQNLSEDQKVRVDACRSYCDKISNLPSARSMCGLDDCKVQYSRTGKISSWCCQMANTWGDKQGARNNPLEPLKDACHKNGAAQKDFLDCTASFKVNGKMSDTCCSQIPNIKKFDAKLGGAAETYCSQKKAAQACKAEYEKNNKVGEACCSLGAATDYKFSASKFFRSDKSFAAALDRNAKGMCAKKGLNNDKDMAACTTGFAKNKKPNGACCIALQKGTLVPGSNGISFESVDRYCNSFNY